MGESPYTLGAETVPGDFGTLRYIAPSTIECGGMRFDITDPEQVNTLLHADGGNVECILDHFLLKLPARRMMHCAKLIYPRQIVRELAVAKGCDWDGVLADLSSPLTQHEWITELHRRCRGDA